MAVNQNKNKPDDDWIFLDSFFSKEKDLSKEEINSIYKDY